MGEPIQQFDNATLTPLARKASGRENLHLEGWQVQAISGGFEQYSRIQRISGVGEADGQSIPWSLILKTITGDPGISANPQASHYWKREVNYYQTGLLRDLPGGVCAPRCFAVHEQPNRFKLFLEDLQNASQGMDWPVDYYRTVARCLGQFNGAYLLGKPIPTAEWIPRQWMRVYIEKAAPNIDLLFRSLKKPLVKRTFRTISPSLIRQAWDERHEIMDALNRLPQTFCHQDAFCRNLYSERTTSGEQIILIDWSFAGAAALGTELAPLVCATLGLGRIPLTEAFRLEQLALDGYLEGLGDAGWQGNPDLVRFGYCVGTFYRYTIGAIVGECGEGIMNKANHLLFEQLWGKSIEEIADSWADGIAWCVPYYEETMRLKKVLKL